MSRAADYTIQGFLYQFNKTALEVLNASDMDTICVEGVIEDVEVVTPKGMTGIQCKYHEAVEAYTASALYKPLLQMLRHFSAPTSDAIRYVLFAHFPNAKAPFPSVGKAECEAALKSKDKNLAKLIAEIPADVSLDDFTSRFKMEFGPSYDEIVAQVSTLLKASGIASDEIDTLAYPNAIHIIAGLSIQHDPAARRITRRQFLERLQGIRTTAISRWTMALRTRKQLLEARRRQLKAHLDKNSRLRYFVVDPTGVDGFDAEIVLFICDYVEKYHFKPAHISSPLFCLLAPRETVQELQHRLYKKGILATDGYVGLQFEEVYFFREPLGDKTASGKVRREFDIRIASCSDHATALNSRKCDDLFILGEPDCTLLETIDVNVERLSGATFKEIKYLLGVSNAYE